MKRLMTTIVSASLAAVLLSGCSFRPVMIDERVSPYDVEATVEKIRTNAAEAGWVVPGVKNMNKSIAKHGGKKIDYPVRIVELCNPRYASDILSEDEGRYSALLMPCAVAVYQKSDGNTYVSSMKAGRVGGLMGGVVSEVMKTVNEDQNRILGFLDQ